MVVLSPTTRKYRSMSSYFFFDRQFVVNVFHVLPSLYLIVDKKEKRYVRFARRSLIFFEPRTRPIFFLSFPLYCFSVFHAIVECLLSCFSNVTSDNLEFKSQNIVPYCVSCRVTFEKEEEKSIIDTCPNNCKRNIKV